MNFTSELLTKNISFTDHFKESENHTIVSYDGALIQTILPLYVRVGFLLVSISCTPTSNSNYIVIQNIIDIAVASVTYFLLGYRFAFGQDINGLIGHYNLDVNNIDPKNIFYGWTAVMSTTGIVTTMFAGRMHVIGCGVNSFLIAGFLQPLFIHWTYTKTGILNRLILNNYVLSVIDQFSTLNIHVCAGIIAFIGHLFFGRKLIKLRDLDQEHLASTPWIVVGYFLIISGLILNMPPLEIKHLEIKYIFFTSIKNNILALSGGIIGAALWMKITNFNENGEEWFIAKYLQGGIMGLVSVSSGIFLYSSVIAFSLGIFSAIIFVKFSKIVLKSAVDDYCLIIPTHLIGGLIGILMPTCFISFNRFNMKPFIIQIGSQLFGFLAVAITSIFITIPLFIFLKKINILRNKFEKKNHKLAIDMEKKILPRDLFERLYKHPTKKGDDEHSSTSHIYSKSVLTNLGISTLSANIGDQ
uniref:Ammonium transporter AmtB-like domain-containing protein n=1 Tax=Clastoptera arizonana TaxID=38151 RepID=A0A1B6E9I6_9HEMI